MKANINGQFQQFYRILPLYVLTKITKNVSLTEENDSQLISLTEHNPKQNILTLVCYISLNAATFTYLSMFNIELLEN